MEEKELLLKKPWQIPLINDSKRGSLTYINLSYTINHISEKWNNDTKGIIYLIEESLIGLKHVMK
jgi:hypothetical protein